MKIEAHIINARNNAKNLFIVITCFLLDALIIAHLSTSEFPRIKLGVGEKPSPEYDLVSWVLGNIPEVDRKAMSEAYSKAADALEEILSGDMDRAMNKYNS